MGRVGHGNQHRVIVSEFENVSQFQGGSFLQGFTVWNFSVNIPKIPRRGVQIKLRNLENDNLIL